jgi:type IX secretion system PorP/SprF family membrane protein
MQRSYILIFVLLITLFVQEANGQTPFMSQNFAATTYFNPASVGFGVNNKLHAFYKNQFAGVGDAYKTIGVSTDFKLFKQEEGESNHFGMGVQAVSEKVLNGVLQTNYISVQIANRIFLNQKQTSYLALGIGGTIISRNIDKELLTFGDQYNSGRLFISSSSESIANIPVKFASSVGLLYGQSSPTQFLQIGASGYFIERNTNDPSTINVNQQFQFIGLSNFEHQIWYDKTILFHADYQKRLESEYYYAGLALGFPIYDASETIKRLYVGCFYRTKDATIPYIGLLFGKYKLGLSYDIYQNDMTSANLHPQTIEFNFTTLLSRRKSENLITLFD